MTYFSVQVFTILIYLITGDVNFSHLIMMLSSRFFYCKINIFILCKFVSPQTSIH